MSQLPTPPAETNRPAAVTKGSMILTGITLALSAVFWLAIFFQLTFLAPATVASLLEFKSGVPWLTARVMYDFIWFVPVFAVIALAICMVVRKKWAWGFALLVLPLLINSFVSLSLLMPTLVMLRNLPGQLAGN